MHLLNKTKNSSYHVVSLINFKYNSCMLLMHGGHVLVINGGDICVSEQQPFFQVVSGL